MSIARCIAHLKRQHEDDLRRVSRKRIARTEVEFCIEAMSHAFSMFRASEEWQAIGVIGRWHSAWCEMWRRVGGSLTWTFHEPIPFRLGERVTAASDNPKYGGVFVVSKVDGGTLTLTPC